MMSLLLLLLSVFAAALPMMLFLVAIWWLDRYEREPPLWVFAAFVWGAVGAVIIALVGSSLLSLPVLLIAPKAAAIVGPVLIAPLVEEPAKILIFIALLRSRHIDGMTDGFVYGAAAGLGFGMTENFLYFTKPALAGVVAPWVALVFMRTFFSAVMHAMATSLVGAALGWARFRGPRVMAVATVVGLGLAMAVHATWNGLVTFDPLLSAGGKLAVLDMLLFMAEFVMVFGVFQVCVLMESLAIRRQLLDEAARGFMSHATARTLSSWSGRSFRRWVPQQVDQTAYTQLAMTLALRKEQAKILDRRGLGDPLKAQILGLRDAMQVAWPYGQRVVPAPRLGGQSNPV